MEHLNPEIIEHILTLCKQKKGLTMQHRKCIKNERHANMESALWKWMDEKQMAFAVTFEKSIFTFFISNRSHVTLVPIRTIALFQMLCDFHHVVFTRT